MTRDDLKLKIGLIAAIVVGISTLSTGMVRTLGLPEAIVPALPWCRLAAFVTGIVTAHLRSSWLPSKAEQPPETNTIDPKRFVGLGLVLLVVALQTPGRAQSLPIDAWTPALSSASGQQAARTVSWFGVGAGVAVKTWDAWKQPNRTKALIAEAGGFSLTAVSTVILKKLVQRERPCAPGDCAPEEPKASFPSGHAGTACFSIPQASGKGWAFVGAIIAAVVAEGRILGNRHWLTDTLSGCANGFTWGYLMARMTR